MDSNIGAWDRVGKLLNLSPQQFVLVNSKDNPKFLLNILNSPGFPTKVTAFTHELSLTGASWGKMPRRLIRARTIKRARSLEKLFKPFQAIAQQKELKIWLGHPLLENGKLYNAYSLVDKNGIIFIQRKKFLYKTERWLFDEPEKWKGNFKNYSVLICSEASAFYSPLAWSGPTRIPEIRKAKSPVIVIPAHWVKNKDYLRRTAQVIARRYVKKEVSGYVYEKGVRPEGSLVFVVNSDECQVVGPYDGDNPNKQSFIYASLKRPGWLKLSPSYITIKEF